MQGITVAISPAGLEFFVDALVAPNGTLTKAINGVHLADYTIPIQNQIQVPTGSQDTGFCSNISIQLSNGTITNFTPTLPSLKQQQKGTFQFVFSSKAFNANYSWLESYTQQNETYVDSSNPDDPGYWANDGPAFPVSNSFNYSAGIGSLITTTNFTFNFDSTKNVWTLPVTSITAVANNPIANIPGNSILQNQDQPGCVQSHVDAATEASIEQGINFQAAIQSAFGGYLTSIPASGQLTPDITFAFGLGDSPLAFPNDQGLTVGATGISAYKGTKYPVTPPTGLPIPAVPTDGHHLQMYVSDYVLNGLYWAFFMDGKLAATVTPVDLPDPNILKVRTWDTTIRELQKYAALDMQIQLQPVQAPTVEFQMVYLFTQTVMNTLQTQLPSLYASISGMLGNVYPMKTFLEQDLTQIYGVSNQYFAQIEQIAQTSGAAVSHDIQFIVTIEGAPPINGQAPFMEFTVNRTDVLESLGLGITNNAQTLTFAFNPGTNSVSVTFNKSNFLSGDVTGNFGTQIWPQACEPAYDKVLAFMGKTGVPLPIMQGFQFLFDQAVLDIQTQGFISILSDVEFKG